VIAQLDGIWSAKEQLIVEAVKKDKARMEEFNKRLATVSRIWFFFSDLCLMGWVIQRPPLTIQESATQVKVFVSVYYQTEEEGPVPVGELPRTSRCTVCLSIQRC